MHKMVSKDFETLCHQAVLCQQQIFTSKYMLIRGHIHPVIVSLPLIQQRLVSDVNGFSMDVE